MKTRTIITGLALIIFGVGIFIYYDFLQSGGVKGVEDFKRSVGGQVYPHKAWFKENYFLKKARYFKYCIKLLKKTLGKTFPKGT